MKECECRRLSLFVFFNFILVTRWNDDSIYIQRLYFDDIESVGVYYVDHVYPSFQLFTYQRRCFVSGCNFVMKNGREKSGILMCGANFFRTNLQPQFGVK